MVEKIETLKHLQICRFCLTENGPLTNIYSLENVDKQTIPLPLQIMASISIEAFEDDGMPELLCTNCNQQIQTAYTFKSNCKRSEVALKEYMISGKLIKPKFKAQNANKQHIRATKRARSIDSMESDEVSKRMERAESIEPQEEVELDLEEDSSQDVSMLDESSQSGGIVKVETDIFPCSRCERSFPLKQLLDLHMKNHNRVRNFQCEECERKFFTKYDLAKHVQTHTSYKPFKCIMCNKSFAREALLHRHEKIHIDVPKYLCPECDKTFFTKESLDGHFELKHKKVRPFECRICKKSFVFKQGLERHEATHTEEKPHKCNYCEASFTSPIKLMRHITSHAGLRPYPCKVCGRTFLLSHHLTRHMRSHYATKSCDVEPVGQHKCDVCSMSFRRKDSLINHSAIHSMVNLKCVICNTEFCSAKEVKDHITTHLAGLPYPCDKCDYSFESQDQLEEHELKHAEMEYEDQIEQEVSEEAKNRGQGSQDEYDSQEDYEDEIAEFTITEEGSISEVVRPSQVFLSEVLDDEGDVMSDIIVGLQDDESEEGDSQQAEEEDEDEVEEVEEIKPIVRTEGTKVYKRKAANKKSADSKLGSSTEESNSKSDKNDDSMINLDHLGLTSAMVKDLPNEQFIDMKVGGIIYKVKKVTMKKTDFEAIAKQENVEMKGGIILKKPVKIGTKEPTKNITIESIIGDPKPTPPKPVVTKTYVKKNTNSVPSSQADS